ncbi:HAD hydrolase-like protein [Candidatus Microgenomates bacterium]|nr:HAD hydrolase-like protein [Candidatus Microgenomates bacterium]
MKKLVLFDIDGTLLEAGHPVARARHSHSIKKIFGIETMIDWSKHSGSTDKKIAVDILREKGVTEKEIKFKIQQILDEQYYYVMKNLKEDFKERVLEGIEELLKDCLKKKEICLGLLTGNYEKIAWFKLEMIGLKKYFDFGLFGNQAEDRNALAKSLFKRAEKHFKRKFKPESVFIIGDTPRDIECAKAAGVKAIGVATGQWSVADLKKADADFVLKNLKDKKKILKIILV